MQPVPDAWRDAATQHVVCNKPLKTSRRGPHRAQYVCGVAVDCRLQGGLPLQAAQVQRHATGVGLQGPERGLPVLHLLSNCSRRSWPLCTLPRILLVEHGARVIHGRVKVNCRGLSRAVGLVTPTPCSIHYAPMRTQHWNFGCGCGCPYGCRIGSTTPHGSPPCQPVHAPQRGLRSPAAAQGEAAPPRRPACPPQLLPRRSIRLLGSAAELGTKQRPAGRLRPSVALPPSPVG